MNNPLNTSSLSKIVLKNTLKTHFSANALIALIVKQIQEVPDYVKLKNDVEMILIACKMIESITADSKVSIDKLETIIQIYDQTFTMAVDDKLMLVNVVNFLHQNKLFNYEKSGFKALKMVFKGLKSGIASLGSNVAANFIH